MIGKNRPILFEVLEPRILLSVDSLLNVIIPDQDQDTLPDGMQQVVQYAELLETQEQVEEQVISDTSNNDNCRPILTLFVGDDNTDDESGDADLSVDNIGPAHTNEIALLSYDSNVETESNFGTTEDDSPPICVNDPEISIEENTSIEIRGPPIDETVNTEIATSSLNNEESEVEPTILDKYAAKVQLRESVELPGLCLVDPAADYFEGQIIYLDFDGAKGVTYDGPVTIGPFDVPAFEAPDELAGQEQVVIHQILGELNQVFAGSGVVFTADKPVDGQGYSTVFIGGHDSPFQSYGQFQGLAEKVDLGNQDLSDNAFVFSEAIVGSQPNVETATAYLSNVIAHEVGHLLGYVHIQDNTVNIGSDLSSLAYETGLHATLASEAGELYRALFGVSGVTLEHETYIGSILVGVVDEDAGTEPLHHFSEGGDIDISTLTDELTNGIAGFDSAYTTALSRFGDAKVYYIGNVLSESYDYLGRAMHLLQDSTVPAHVHNDQHLIGNDMYEVNAETYFQTFYIYFDSLQNGSSWDFQNWGGDWSNPQNLWSRSSIYSSLKSLFRETTDYTDDYDSDDYPGDYHNNTTLDGDEFGLSGALGRMYHSDWANNEVNGWGTRDLNGTEIGYLARDLGTWAIEQSAMLMRYFYDKGLGKVVAAPSNLNAPATSIDSIDLAWNNVSGADGYVVYRSISSSSGFSRVGITSSTGYSDTGLAANTTYHYRVFAYNYVAGLGSGYSSVSVMTDSNDPDDPDDPGPGRDYPDETYDLSSSQFPTPWTVDTQSPIGVLLSGYGSGLGYILGKYYIASAPVKQDLTILGEPNRDVFDLDVLLIGSGGLGGLDSSPTFCSMLDHFVASGGTVIALTQQRGYEFAALPGDLAGYGWNEDQSCHYRAAQAVQQHPMIAGQTPTVTANVDGFFSVWPSNSELVLNRTKNGMPTLLTYSYGQGRVIATTLYSDWAYGHGQTSDDELRLIRDIVDYGVYWRLLEERPEIYYPGNTVEFPILVMNEGYVAAAYAEITLIDPDRNEVENFLLPTEIEAGQLGEVVFSYTLPSDAQCGIWTVRVYLLDSDGNPIAEQYTIAPFVVSALAELEPNVSDLKFFVTADTEYFTYGSNANFTFHVRNNGIEPQTVTIAYDLTMHSWVTQDKLQYSGQRSITVEPLEETTFVYTPKIIVSLDRLRASAYDSSGYVGTSELAVYVEYPQVELTVSAEGSEFIPGQEIPVHVELLNRSSFVDKEDELIVRLLDPLNTLVETRSVLLSIDAGAELTDNMTFILPEGARSGVWIVSAEFGGVAYGVITFVVPVADLSVRPDFEIVSPENDARISFELFAILESVPAGVISASIKDPSGQVIWSDEEPFDAIEANQSVDVEMIATLGGSRFGEYVLEYTTLTGGIGKTYRVKLPCSVAVSFVQNGYAESGTPIPVTVNVSNSGFFNQELDVVIQISDFSFSQTNSLNLAPGESKQIPLTMSVPPGTPAGTYYVQVAITLGDSQTLVGSHISVRASPLLAELLAELVQSGNSLPIRISSNKSYDTTCQWSAKLIDMSGIITVELSGTIAVQAGMWFEDISLPVLASVTTGQYVLEVSLKDEVTQNQSTQHFVIQVAGPNVDITLYMDSDTYSPGATPEGQLDVTGDTTLNGLAGNLSLLSSSSTATMQPEMRWTGVDGFGAGKLIMGSTIDSSGALSIARDYEKVWESRYVGSPTSLSVNSADESCWIADSTGSVIKIDAQGNELVRVEGFFDDVFSRTAISVNPTDGSCWVATHDWDFATDSYLASVVKLDADGNELLRVGGYSSLKSVSVNSTDGSCWVAGWKGDMDHPSIVKLDAGGNELVRVEMPNNRLGVSVNPTDGSCWVAGGYFAIKLDADGNELVRVENLYAASVSVNPTDGSCWVGTRIDAVKLDADGNELVRVEGFIDELAVSINPTDGSCWVADLYFGTVVKLDSDGNELVRVEAFSDPLAISVNPADGSCWVGESGKLVKLDSSGGLMVNIQGFCEPVNPSVNPTDGSCWVDNGSGLSPTVRNYVVKLDTDGNVLVRVDSFNYPTSISVNPADGSCWVADWDGYKDVPSCIVKLDADGNELVRRELSNGLSPHDVAVNHTDGSCWASGFDSNTRTNWVMKLDASGYELLRVEGFESVASISVNPTDGSCWLSDYSAKCVVKLDAYGNELVRIEGLNNWGSGLSVNSADGSCWVSCWNSVVKLDAFGNELLRVEGFSVPCISVNPIDGSCWVGDHYSVVKLDAYGNELVRIEGLNNWGAGLSVNSADESCWLGTYEDTLVKLAPSQSQYLDGGVWLGTYASGDTGHVWGTLEWQANAPTGTTVRFATRSADTFAQPTEADWSSWSEVYAASGSAITSPPGGWIQVRCELTSDGTATPTVTAIQLMNTVVGEDVIWQHTIAPIDLQASVMQTYSQQLPILNETGQYRLKADLICPQSGQVIATAETSFLVTDADVALMLLTDRAVYKPYAQVNVTGSVVNQTASNVSNIELEVSFDDVVVYSETFDLLADGTRAFSFVTTAGEEDGTLTAVLSGPVTFDTSRTVRIDSPVVHMTLDTPAVVSREQFTATLRLENTSEVPVDLLLDFIGQQQTITIPIGQSWTQIETLAINQDTTITATISGDIADQISAQVIFGEDVVVQVLPESTYLGGTVAIPYTVSNQGQFDSQIEINFALSGQPVRIETILVSVGQIVNSELVYDLPAGDYTLDYTQPFGQGSVDFRVVDGVEIDLNLSTVTLPEGSIEATVTVKNTGPLEFSGFVSLELPFWAVDESLEMNVGQEDVFIYTVQTAAAVPGVYNLLAIVRDDQFNPLTEQTTQITVIPADIRLVSIPQGLEFDAGEFAELDFNLHNFGGQPGRAEVRFHFETIDRTHIVWLEPGEEQTISFSAFLPEDLEDKYYVGRLTINDVPTNIPLKINGVKIQVASALDEVTYTPGDIAHLILTVTNVGLVDGVDLFAKVNYDDFEETKPFVLTAQQQIIFDIPVDTINGQKLAYGIYFDSGRSLWLDSRYLRSAPLVANAVSLVTDKDVYIPGETVNVTVLTDQTGTMEVEAPGFSGEVQVAEQTQFSFILPGIMTQGTFFVNWVFGEQQGALPFDVAGLLVRVLECRLDKPRYYPTQELNATLLLDFGQQTDAKIIGHILGPDGTSVEAFDITGAFDVGLANIECNSIVESSACGIHRLYYQIIHTTSGLLLAAGVEAFDVGDGSIVALKTDKPEYLMGEEVTATIGVVGHNAEGILQLYIDSEQVWQQQLQLIGYQDVEAQISGVTTGNYVLKAVLTIDGLTNSREVVFSVTANSPPVALDDTYVVDEDTTLTTEALQGVLNNDSDPNGDLLTAMLVASVSHGVLELNEDGSFEYIPDLNFYGSDSFTYSANDGVLDSNIATVNITVNPVNDIPVITDLLITPQIDENSIATLTAQFADPDTLDSHSVVIDWADGSSDTLVLAVGIRDFSVSHQYLDDEPTGTPLDDYTISATVSDTTGSNTVATTVTVENVAPTVELDPMSAIDEGGIATLTGTITDPGTLDTFALEINWGDPSSPNNDEIYALGCSTTGVQTFTLSHQYLDDNPSGTPTDSYTIAATVTDDDAATGDNQTAVDVNNLAPEITEFSSEATLSNKGSENEDVAVFASFVDVGKIDTHTAEIHWGDGIVTQGTVTESAGVGTVSASHAYAFGGIYTISLILEDDDSGIAQATTTAIITGVGIQNGQLQVIGSDAKDKVSINLVGGKHHGDNHKCKSKKQYVRVNANFLPKVHSDGDNDEDDDSGSQFRDFDMDAVSSILMVLCDGDDHATIAGNIAIDAIIDGGHGRDKLKGGAGNDIVLGGAGNDKIQGGSGADILIGGLGGDRLVGNRGDDILIGDTTVYDSDQAEDKFADIEALLAILDEWTSGRDFETRVNNLKDGTGSNDRLNGSYFLQKGITVFDDGVRDHMTGSSGKDWFISFDSDKDHWWRCSNRTSLHKCIHGCH